MAIPRLSLEEEHCEKHMLSGSLSVLSNEQLTNGIIFELNKMG